jgi:hypothetical protein
VRRLALAAAFALAACGQQQQAPAQDDAPVEAAASANNTIGPDGAAGISAALALDVAIVRAAAPSWVVTEIEGQIEGQPYKAITLSAGGEEVFRLLPTAEGGHIHAVVTASPQARGPMGEVVGQSLFGVAPPEQVPFCLVETIKGAQGFACSTNAAGTFWRVYTLPEAYDGPAGSFDEIEPDVLHDATLAEMRWIAPRAE